jgi:hypothetical protein
MKIKNEHIEYNNGCQVRNRFSITDDGYIDAVARQKSTLSGRPVYFVCVKPFLNPDRLEKTAHFSYFTSCKSPWPSKTGVGPLYKEKYDIENIEDKI